MSLVEGTTVRVEVGDDWYEIKTELGWYDKKRASFEDAIKLAIPTESVDAGQVEAADVVNVQISLADQQLRKLRAYLVRWSHKNKLNLINIKRIPPQHAEALLARIAKLETSEAEEAGAVP